MNRALLPRSQDSLKRAQFKVEGLECGRCVSWVHDLLKRLAGSMWSAWTSGLLWCCSILAGLLKMLLSQQSGRLATKRR